MSHTEVWLLSLGLGVIAFGIAYLVGHLVGRRRGYKDELKRQLAKRPYCQFCGFRLGLGTPEGLLRCCRERSCVVALAKQVAGHPTMTLHTLANFRRRLHGEPEDGRSGYSIEPESDYE